MFILILRYWVDQNTPFELRGSIHRKRRVTIDDLNLKSKKASLQFNASVDLVTEAIEGRFKLQSDDLSPMEKLASIKGSGGTVDGHFSGSLLKPEFSLDFHAAELQAGDAQAKDVQGHVNVVFMSPIDVTPIQIRAESTGKVGQLTFKNGSELLSEKDVAWTLAVEGPNRERLSIEELTLMGRSASVSLSGWLDTVRLTGSLDANIEVVDFQAFSGLVDATFAGSTRMQAKITGDSRNRSFSARITGKYRPPETSDSSLVSLMGRQVGYAGTFTYDGQMKINGTDLLLDTTSGKLKGDVAYDLGDGGLNGVFQMEIPKLDRFSPILGKEIQGSVLVKGAIKGLFQRLGVEARMVSREIRVEKTSLEILSAGFRIEGSPTENKGKLDLDLYVEHERVQGKTHFALTHQLLSFTDLSLNGAGVNITGALSLDLEQRLIEGTLQGATDDLVPLSTLLQQEVKGAAKIYLETSGTNSGQRFVFKIDSSDLSIQDLFAGKVKLQGEIHKALKAPEGLVTVSLREGKLKGSSVTSLEMNVRGTPRQFHFEGNVEGKTQEDFNLETSGRVSLSPEGDEILLNRFQGRHGKIPVNLVRPVVVISRINGLDFEPMTLQIGSADWSVREKSEELSVEGRRFLLEKLRKQIAESKE